jgi:hypothetical protein
VRAPATLVAFALVVAAAFGAGAAIGTVVGPLDVDGDPGHVDVVRPNAPHGEVEHR